MTYPLLRVTSWRPPSRLDGSSVRWEGTDSGDGFGALCESSEACVPATSVRLRFDSQADGRRVTGDLDVELEGGRVVRGPFDATRLGHEMLCG